jgi:hypothetical protein
MVDRDELLFGLFSILHALNNRQEVMCKQQELCIFVFSFLLVTVVVGFIGTVIYYRRK